MTNLFRYSDGLAAAPPTSSFLTESPHSMSSPDQQQQQQQEQQNPQERHPSGGASTGLNARSCVTCRRRKVKCDKQVPCSNCAKQHIQCVFPAPGRAPRRPRAGGKVVSDREAELLKRLRRLEGVVEELSGQVEIEQSKQSPSSDISQKDLESSGKSGAVRVIGMDEGSGSRKDWILKNFNLGAGPPKTTFDLEKGFGRLVVDEGKSRYTSSPFWASISEEVDQIREILNEEGFDSDEDGAILPSNVITEADHQSFIMGYSSSDVNLQSLHPLPSQIPFYWQTFLENVDPLLKLVHAPTMNKVIKEVQSNPNSLERSTEALMFAIYFATITSMNTEEVRSSFGVEKEYLQKQYRFGVEQALARAGFLNTNEIVTVQALVLFLYCVRRHDDTRFVWSLTGLCVRIAQSLGLHRDGTRFRLSPFDTEMRRRLWWHVCMLDFRASEDFGSDLLILHETFDTRFPLSINDTDLDLEASELPNERPGLSEMTFCLIRIELCSLSQRLVYVPPGTRDGQSSPLDTRLPLSEQERLVRECSKHLEEKYLKYCEDAAPLYWVGATVARLVCAKMHLVIYHPLVQPGKPDSLPQSIKDRLFMSSIEILEYARMLESEASTKSWGWLFHTYVQWNAIAFLLGELCTRSNSIIADRAWRAVDNVFNGWGEAVQESRKSSHLLWQPMRKLMAKARRKREENMRNNMGTAGDELGMEEKYVLPSPQLGDRPGGWPVGMAGDRMQRQKMTDAEKLFNPDAPVEAGNMNAMTNGDLDMMVPQAIGMGMLAPDQIQLPSQQQQMVSQQQTPWLMNDSALVDLDMSAIDEEVNWDGWDDLVTDFQMDPDMQNMAGPNGRGPTLPGMSTWW